MNLIEKWEEMPIGIGLIRMLHQSTGEHCFHLQMKVDNRPWYNQPLVPQAYSCSASKEWAGEFWDWAIKNLPVYDYKDVVKPA